MQKELVSAEPEPCEECSHKRCATIRRDRKRAAALREPTLIQFLMQMTMHLMETHMDEFSDNHAGDADHGGEAPEDCSYCKTVGEVRAYLKSIGVDVSPINPQEFE